MTVETLFAASSRVEYTSCLVQTLNSEAVALAESIAATGLLYNELHQEVKLRHISCPPFSHWPVELPRDAIIVDALRAAGDQHAQLQQAQLEEKCRQLEGADRLTVALYEAAAAQAPIECELFAARCALAEQVCHGRKLESLHADLLLHLRSLHSAAIGLPVEKMVGRCNQEQAALVEACAVGTELVAAQTVLAGEEIAELLAKVERGAQEHDALFATAGGETSAGAHAVDDAHGQLSLRSLQHADLEQSDGVHSQLQDTRMQLVEARAQLLQLEADLRAERSVCAAALSEHKALAAPGEWMGSARDLEPDAVAEASKQMVALTEVMMMHRQVEALEAEKAAAIAGTAVLEATLSAVEAEAAATTAENQNLKNRAAKFESDQTKSQTNLAIANTLSTQLQDRLGALQKQLDTQSRTSKKASDDQIAELSRAVKKADALTAEKEAATAEAAMARASMQSVEAEKVAATAEAAMARASMQSVEAEKVAAAESAQLLESNRSELLLQVDRLQQQIEHQQEGTSRVAALSLQLEDSHQQLEDSNQQLEDSNRQLVVLQKQLQDASNELIELRENEQFATPRSLCAPRGPSNDSIEQLQQVLLEAASFLEHAETQSLELQDMSHLEQRTNETTQLALSQLTKAERGLLRALEQAWTQKAATEHNLAHVSSEKQTLLVHLEKSRQELKDWHEAAASGAYLSVALDDGTNSKYDEACSLRKVQLQQMENELLLVQRELQSMQHQPADDHAKGSHEGAAEVLAGAPTSRVSDLASKAKQSKNSKLSGPRNNADPALAAHKPHKEPTKPTKPTTKSALEEMREAKKKAKLRNAKTRNTDIADHES